MILVLVTLVETKKMYKFCAETFAIAFVYSLSLLAIHIVITGVFRFTIQDSLIILIPVFLVSFPAVIYGYYIGVRRYYAISKKSPNSTKAETTNKTFLKTVKSFATISLIIIPTFIGLYLIIIEKSFFIGIVVSTLGAISSIPVSKKIYESLIQKGMS
jgi:hypothetical protein